MNSPILILPHTEFDVSRLRRKRTPEASLMFQSNLRLFQFLIFYLRLEGVTIIQRLPNLCCDLSPHIQFYWPLKHVYQVQA